MSVEPIFDWLSKTFFSPKGDALNALEQAALDSFAGVLRPADRRKLDAQISHGRGVFRQTSGMIVEFLAKGIRENELFSNQDDEMSAAYVFFDGQESQRCSIILIRGRLACLNFVKKPRKKAADGQVAVTATLVADLESSHSLPAESATGSILGQPAADWLLSNSVSRYRPAKSDEQIAAFLRFVGPHVPTDIDSVLCAFDGLEADCWSFAGTQGRQIVWPDKRCLQILAEDENSTWALCLIVASSEGEYAVLDQAAADIESVGSEFEVALRAFVAKVDVEPRE